jgi:hypothetical protein
MLLVLHTWAVKLQYEHSLSVCDKMESGCILAKADGRNSRRDSEKCIMGTFMIRLLANY